VRTLPRRVGRRPIDLTGRRFGCWTVLGYGVGYPETHHIRWHCRCACGTERLVDGQKLRRGGSRSCGCGCRQERHIEEVVT
jgi:hypothetical protein